MKEFFTRTGDEGFTGLLGEERVPKFHPRTMTLGDLDEAVAAIGIARANARDLRTPVILIQVQRDLYHIMAEVSATPANAARFRTINPDHVSWLEKKTNELASTVVMPSEFILPGDSPNSASVSLSRAVVRRAERSLVKLHHDGEIENSELIRYVNRLSSLLFVLEFIENSASGIAKTSLAKA
jgi:cob(I)alamin adenosyltransferase